MTLATDASPFGLAAGIAHIINGKKLPVASASHSLTRMESHYSQLDCEATAVCWLLKQFYQYLYGSKFYSHR